MPLSRIEFWNRIGLVKEIEPLTEQAYNFVESLEREKPNQGAAHASPWHLSFHGSKFPGDKPYACGRQALYSMMDLPGQPFGRPAIQIMDAGKDIEDRLVMKWYQSGQLLSAPPFPGVTQTQFEDPEVWLTSTVDAIVLHLLSSQGVVVEVKTKYAHDLEAMRNLVRGPDESHVYQLKCQIGLAHEQGGWNVQRCHNTGRLAIVIGRDEKGESIKICPQHGHDRCLHEQWIAPPDYGYIYYVSRDNPADTFEFMFEYDPDFMEAGRAKLAEWKENWLEGILPQTNFSDKRFSHPFEWQWSKPQYPCSWCDYGAICREDHREAVKLGRPLQLSESAGIDNAKEVRSDYNLDLVNAAVRRRWNAEELTSA